jgi:hypothetical protein
VKADVNNNVGNGNGGSNGNDVFLESQFLNVNDEIKSGGESHKDDVVIEVSVAQFSTVPRRLVERQSAERHLVNTVLDWHAVAVVEALSVAQWL